MLVAPGFPRRTRKWTAQHAEIQWPLWKPKLALLEPMFGIENKFSKRFRWESLFWNRFQLEPVFDAQPYSFLIQAENLKLLMQKMENWAHRLYPKMQFEEFIDKVESLGGKKEVQTCLKRIRLDMPITHEDFVEDRVPEESDRVPEESDPAGDGVFPEDPFVHSTPAPASLTEEQQQRIELNKRLALERRLAKQKELESSQKSIQGDADEPSTSSSGQYPIQENQDVFNQSSNQSPLKEKPAALQNSPLNDEGASPVPNGIVDDDDSN